jgi:hypothetical protein
MNRLALSKTRRGCLQNEPQLLVNALSGKVDFPSLR